MCTEPVNQENNQILSQLQEIPEVRSLITKGNEQKQPVSFLSVSEDIPTLTHIALHNLNKKSNG